VIGPLIDMKAVEKVEARTADALNEGAKIVTQWEPNHASNASAGWAITIAPVLTDRIFLHNTSAKHR
jgi:acyl-CoA reductase-like NAD-dependent aldehyde dehydrogenase